MPSKKLSAYAKKLRDPRWQQCRLRILDAADWQCQWCGTTTRELQVHHGHYRRGANPWEYEDKYLHVLCDKCHEKAEYERSELYRVIGMMPPHAIYDLFPVVLDYGAKVIPKKFQAPEPEPAPEVDPSLDEEADQAELEEFFGSLKNYLKD